MSPIPMDIDKTALIKDMLLSIIAAKIQNGELSESIHFASISQILKSLRIVQFNSIALTDNYEEIENVSLIYFYILY